MAGLGCQSHNKGDSGNILEDISRRLHKKRPGNNDDIAGGVASTVARKITHPAEPEALSGIEISRSKQGEQRMLRMLGGV